MIQASESSHMKWNGWGDPNKQFDITDKPELWPYIVKVTGIAPQQSPKPPVDLDLITLPSQRIHPEALAEIQNVLHPNQIALDDFQRLIHCYGKSFRDLWRMRNGLITDAPDCVCYPQNENEVKLIIAIAVKHNIVVIPFGGGSNIVGGVEVRQRKNRMAISLDLSRMNKVLSVDAESLTARVQAGTMGPMLEKQLNALGVTLGHFPDSFEHSSIGGWVATRSAGMQSDKYGKIEDMVVSLRMVTPQGILVTSTVPKASNGLDVNHFCIGSEGTLGVITELTMRVHPLPEYKSYYGYLFPDFESGVEAVYECVRNNCSPLITRLNDPDKTALSFAYKTKDNFLNSLLSKVVKNYLKYIKKFDFNKACLLLTAFEGNKQDFNQQKKKAEAIYRKFGAFNLGSKPGRAFEKGKYDFPYLRDFAMDYGIAADVSETATVWSNLLPMYHKVRLAITNAIESTGSKPWCGCHISHTYHTGASLYFTFAFQQNSGVEQYLHVKKAAEDAFLDNGGCVSHHHAVGFEHLPWVMADVSPVGMIGVEGIKNAYDPQKIMNPGKLIPDKENSLRNDFCLEDSESVL